MLHNTVMVLLLGPPEQGASHTIALAVCAVCCGLWAVCSRLVCYVCGVNTHLMQKLQKRNGSQSQLTRESRTCLLAAVHFFVTQLSVATCWGTGCRQGSHHQWAPQVSFGFQIVFGGSHECLAAEGVPIGMHAGRFDGIGAILL